MPDERLFEEQIGRKREKSARPGGPRRRTPDRHGGARGGRVSENERDQQGAGADPGGNPARREGIPPRVG